jgi:ribosomal protein L37AE/L43A
MLDYGYRSRCCLAPLRLGKKRVKKHEIKVWVCVKCGTKDVPIISKADLQSQENYDLEEGEKDSD